MTTATLSSPAVYSGPVIDRDVFGPELPAFHKSVLPYFDVGHDRDPTGPRYRFWFEPARGGWVRDPKWRG